MNCVFVNHNIINSFREEKERDRERERRGGREKHRERKEGGGRRRNLYFVLPKIFTKFICRELSI